MNGNSDRSSPDCTWFEAAMEGFFSGALARAELTRFESHAAGCTSCSTAFEELRAVDPLMKDLHRYRMAIAVAAASSRSRLHWGRTMVLAGAMAGAVAIGLAFWPQVPPPPVPINAGIKPPEKLPESPDKLDKKEQENDPQLHRTKPDEPKSIRKPDSSGMVATQQSVTEEFALIDDAGQISTLDNYRGHVFLFGVVAPADPRTAVSLERLYRTFGADILLVGVSNSARRTPAPLNTTFRTLRNNGSRLLGAYESDFILLDERGNILLKGSLAADPESVVRLVRGKLDQKK